MSNPLPPSPRDPARAPNRHPDHLGRRVAVSFSVALLAAGLALVGALVWWLG